MIGRDWTHQGVAKLFTDITNNGYQLLYLTSRSVGQADTTRGYLKSIVQGKYTIPEGPVIMSRIELSPPSEGTSILHPPFGAYDAKWTQGGDTAKARGVQNGLFTRFTAFIPSQTSTSIDLTTIKSFLRRLWKSNYRCPFLQICRHSVVANIHYQLQRRGIPTIYLGSGN